MATYDSLTTEQKGTLQEWMNFVRALTGETARMNNHAVAAWDAYNTEASAIIASLDAGETIPNTSGLAGAVSVTKEETVTVASHIDTIMVTPVTAAHRAAWNRFAGAANMSG